MSAKKQASYEIVKSKITSKSKFDELVNQILNDKDSEITPDEYQEMYQEICKSLFDVQVNDTMKKDEVRKSLKKVFASKFTRARKPKDPNAKKTPTKNPYIKFCKEQRATVKNDLGKDAKATDVMKELGARWKALSTEQKTSYKDKEVQEEEKKVVKSKSKGSKGPKKGSKSALSFYVNENKSTIKDNLEDGENFMKGASRIFKELDADEKKKYEDKAKKHNESLKQESDSETSSDSSSESESESDSSSDSESESESKKKKPTSKKSSSESETEKKTKKTVKKSTK